MSGGQIAMPERRPAAERPGAWLAKTLTKRVRRLPCKARVASVLPGVCSGRFTRGILSPSPVDASTCLASASRYLGAGACAASNRERHPPRTARCALGGLTGRMGDRPCVPGAGPVREQGQERVSPTRTICFKEPTRLGGRSLAAKKGGGWTNVTLKVRQKPDVQV